MSAATCRDHRDFEIVPAGFWDCRKSDSMADGNKDVADMDPPTRWTTLDGPGKLIGLSKAERDKKSLNKC